MDLEVGYRSPKIDEGGEIFSNSLAPLSPGGRGAGGEGKIPVFKKGEITSDSLLPLTYRNFGLTTTNPAQHLRTYADTLYVVV